MMYFTQTCSTDCLRESMVCVRMYLLETGKFIMFSQLGIQLVLIITHWNSDNASRSFFSVMLTLHIGVS